MRVVVTATAAAQIDRIDAWWREHRPAAPSLFAEELAGALDLMATAPMLGRRYRSAPTGDVRRMLLRATRFHAYYRVEGEVVVVLAVWSGVRGYGPLLE